MATTPTLRQWSSSQIARLRKQQQRKRFERLRSRHSLFEPLEERQMLTVASDPVQPLPTGASPLEVKLGPVDAGVRDDLVALSADGQLTVALNQDDNRWQSIQTVNLGLGSLSGLELTLIDANPFSDVVVQGPNSISLFTGDASGNFTLADTVTPGAAGTLAPAGGGRIGMQASLLNTDFHADLVTVAPGTNELLVFLGTGTASLDPAPDRYVSGGGQPIVAAIGNVIGNLFPDVVVGHADGTLTWFEGVGDGTLLARTDLTVTGLGDIFDVTIADLDGDGDDDVAVSGGTQVTILWADNDPLTSSPIVNGDFSAGLTGWQTEIVGHSAAGTPGRVSGLGGFAQLRENDAFLVSVSQTFAIPPSPQTISFDIESLGLEDPFGGVPDAFEVSLLDAAGGSLVPTHAPQATSFFNANPGGVVSLAAGVTFDGRTVTLDTSGLTPGTAAALYFDLVGNPPGTASVASIDNVAIAPNFLAQDSSTAIPLPGPFVDAAGITSADVDGDGNRDLVIADAGADKLIVFNGDGSGGFTRSEIDTSGRGATPLAVATGTLTAGDTIADIAVTMFNSNQVLTPVVPDTESPTALLTDPNPSQPILDPVPSLTVTFSEDMLDTGPGGNNSVTNPAAYALGGPGGAIPITSVTYDAVAHTAILAIDPGFAPLADGQYQLTLEGDDPSVALQDLSGNALGMGAEQALSFQVNSTGPALTTADSINSAEGSDVPFTATFLDAGASGPFTTTIQWGDGTTSAGTVSFANGSGTVTANHTYADNGLYTVSTTVTDPFDRSTTLHSTATIANVAPSVTPSANVTIDEDAPLTITAATFTDPGFTSAAAGTEETFTATIDWGDGTAPEPGIISVTQGAAGVATSGSVSGTHTYVDHGVYTVTVTVTDDDGGAGTASLVVDVQDTNTAPTIIGIDPLAGGEGESISLGASFTDPLPESGPHIATIDWGDGTTSSGSVTFAGGMGTVSAQHTYASDGIYSVVLTITDFEGLTAIETATANITGASPVLTVSANQSVLEDTLTAFALGTFTDASFDPSETFTGTVDWGDGNVEAANVSWTTGSQGVPTTGQLSGNHSYSTPGSYTVTVTVTDDDGSSSGSFVVAVTAVAPTVTSGGDLSGSEGQVFTFTATFTDPGESDGHAAAIDWGDGSTTGGTVSFSSGQGSVTASHTYADNGSYPISLVVTDPGGATGTATATATVANVAPSVLASPDQTFLEGAPITLELAGFEDPGFTSATAGTVESFTATIDWGDGTLEPGTVDVVDGQPGLASIGTVSGTHQYTATGSYNVVVTVSDDDGQSGSASLVITIQPDLSDPTKFMVVNDNSFDQAIFRYDANGEFLNQFPLTAPNPRGAATLASGNPLWVIDKDDLVYVYDTSGDTLLGSWLAMGIKHQEGIATDGQDIWIVDDFRDRLFFYDGAASRLSGSQSETSFFELAPGNDRPSGITTDGQTLWVSDDGVPASVFAYDLAGNLLGSWQLDPLNQHPSGVTINPGGGDDVWVVDRQDDAVFRYNGGRNLLSGSATADIIFALDTADKHPEGIADPTMPINIGDPVPQGTITVAGQVDEYIFNAPAGEVIFVDFSQLAGGSLSTTLIDPLSTTLYTTSGFSFNNHDRGPLELVDAGDYMLEVTSPTAGTTYTFRIWDVPETTVTPITFGTPIPLSSISVPGETDQYSFTGTAGATLFFDVTTGNQFGHTWQLHDSLGNQIFSAPLQDREGVVLPVNDTYTINVDGVGDFTGNYQFAVYQTPPIDVRAISLNEFIDNDSISVPGERNLYNFQATAGQQIFFDAILGNQFGINRTLTSPSGATLLSGGIRDANEITLTETGQYELLLDGIGSFVGDYQFYVWDSTDVGPVPLPLNNAVNDYLAPQKVFTYQIVATAGQELILDEQENERVIPSPQQKASGFTLTAPSGTDVFTNALDDLFATPLTETGTYTLTVSQNDPNDADSRGAFAFRLQEVVVPPAGGQRDGVGTEFWFALPASTTNQTFTAFISSEPGAQVVLDIPHLGYVDTLDVLAEGVSQVALPGAAVMNQFGNDIIENKGIHVTSTAEVTIQVMMDGVTSSDAYLALPRDALGTEHIVVAQQDGCASVCNASEFTVVATEDNTTLTITPSTRAGNSGSYRLEGVPYSIALDQGQTYRITGGELDLSSGFFTALTGTEVLSDKPVFLLGGNQATFVPHQVPAADYLIEQIPAVDSWGRRFVTSPPATRDAYTLKAVASQDATTVSIDGSAVATLDRGQYHEQIVNGAVEVTADKPISLAQLAHGQDDDNPPASPTGILGDPFLLQLPPVEQFRQSYSVTVPASRFDPNFINVVAPDIAVGTITLDGVAIDPGEFTAVGASGYSFAQLAVTPQDYRLESTLPFGVTVYGFENYGSYAYTGGTQLAPVGLVSSLSISPAVATLLPNTTHTVTSTVTDAGGSQLADVLVEFTVSGAHTARGFARTDADGLASFSYPGDTLGSDTIVAAVGTKQVQATADWISAVPSIVVTAPADGAQFRAGSTALVLGRALPGPTQARIVAVTVRGAGFQPASVDTVDAAGNFFTAVDVALGTSTFTFTAIDELGQTATTTLDLTGTPVATGVDADQLQDTTLSGALTYQATTFNRAARVLHADVLLTNQADEGLGPFVLAAYDPFNPLQVDLANSEGTVDESPFVSFDTELGGTLTPGATSAPLAIEFTNLARERFDFDVRLLALGNTPPRFTSSPETTAILDRPYQYTALAIDNEDNALTYTLLSGPESLLTGAAGGTIPGAGGAILPSPAGGGAGGGGLIQWTPTITDQGTHTINVRVSDGFGGTATQTFQLNVIPAPPNRPPRFQSAPVTTIATGEDYSYAPVVSDPDGDTLTFSLDTAPAGMTIDSVTGQVTFLAPADGNYAVSILADDGNGASALQSYTLTVGAAGTPNASPIISTTPSTQATAGSLYLYFPVATDPDGDALSFSLLAAPAGMTLTDVRPTSIPGGGAGGGGFGARIDWTPTTVQLGPQPVLLVVQDGQGGSASQSFTIEVAAVPPNQPPVITSSPQLIATQNVAYHYDVDAEDPEATTLSYALVNAPAGMTISTATGLISWTPAASNLGANSVTVLATDAAGLTATQSFTLDVRPPNTPPVFTSTPVAAVAAGGAYRYGALATDAEDAVTYSLISAPVGMTIGAVNGILFWKTTLADLGNQSITLRATDDRGLFTDQSYTLSVTADVTPPLVTVSLASTLIDVGDTVRINVAATDDVEVLSLTLEIDGVAQTLDATGGIFYTPTSGGLPTIVATATDTSGNIGTGSPNPRLRVLDPTDTDAPFVEITSPATGSIVTYLTDIVGTVTDDNLEFYQLQYALAGTGEFTTFHTVTCSVTLASCLQPPASTLGTFDPTLLANDLYEVRLLAQDTNGLQSSATIELSVEAQAKLGNFRLEFTDLEIPLAGIPIQINRIYDTLEANISGDFGFGWSLGLYSPRIRETVRVSPSEQAGAGLFGANPFRQGTRVYLTAPDGRRVGFTFDPEPEPALLGTVFHPRFVADPGVYDQLIVDDIPLQQNANGTFGLYLTPFAYNPSQYTLVTKDQLRYRIDQFTGIQDITDRNSVVLSFEDNGVFSSTGQSISWIRDQQRRITEIIDPAGNSILYTYDAGDLISVTDQVLNETTISYLAEPAHYLDELVDPLGNLVSRSIYDNAGRLSQVVDVFGNPITQTYDLSNNAETIADRLGNETTFVFDDRGNVTQIIDALGSTSIVYDDPQNSDAETSITNPRGATTQFGYDALGNVVSIVQPDRATTIEYNSRNDITRIEGPSPLVPDPEYVATFVTMTYDANGNLTSFTNAGGEMEEFTYDALGRVVSVTDPRANTMEFEYSTFNNPDLIRFADGAQREVTRGTFGQLLTVTDELGETVHFDYDDSGKQLRITDPLGNTYENFYQGNLLVRAVDPLARETLFDYDEKNRLITITDPNSGEIRRTFDANDRVVSLTNQLGQTESWTYNAAGDITTYSNTAGQVTIYTYDSMSNLVAVENARGFVTQYTYDDLNRLVTLSDAAANTESYAYDLRDDLVAITDRNGATTAFAYDSVGRLLQVTDPLNGVQLWTYDDEGNNISYADERGNVTTYEYDNRNRLVRQIDAAAFEQLWQFDVTNRLEQYTDEEGNVYQYAYAANNLLLSVTDPLGGGTSFTYDAVGNRIKTIDELGRGTTRSFDALDRVVSVVDANGELTQFEYDALGNLLAISDPLGNETGYQYDAMNQVSVRTDPLGNSETFSYDEVGNLVTRVDRLGRVTEYVYDGQDRVTSEIWKATDGTALQTYSFAYDANGNLTMADGPQSAYAFGYDLLNSVTSTDGTINSHGVNLLLDYSYDPYGNRTMITDHFGVSVHSSYDVRNLLSSMEWTGGGVDDARIDYTREGRGLVSGISRYSDLVGTNRISQSNITLDARGRVTQIQHVDALDAVLADEQLTYDLASQITQQVINGEVSNYAYDDLGQLLSASNSGRPDEAYLYNEHGNRIDVDNVVGPNNQLLSDGTFDYEYDDEGNLIRTTAISTGDYTIYDYDHRNRLTHVVSYSSGGIMLSETTFAYDMFDRLIARTVDVDGAGPQSSETTLTMYDGANAWADFDESGNVVARYLFGQGLDNIVARWRPGEGTAWYLTDHLGSIRDIIDVSGAVIEHLEYDSFGNVLLETNAAAGDRFKFTGREWDASTGLYYYRARFYDPATGRLITQDPIGFAAGDTNLYRYVGNNPLSFIDPSGNVAAVSATTGYELSRIAVAIASGLSGFIFGYTCGYLNAFVVQGLEGDAAQFHAERLGLLVGSIDFAASIALGSQGFGAQPIGTRIFGTGVFIAGSAALSLASSFATGEKVSDNPAGKAIDSICIAVSAAGGHAAGRAITPRTLSTVERRALQAVADEFGTTIDVVGSRAAGRGRGVGTRLPVGKGLGTRSDIDLRIDPQLDIDTGGRLSDALKSIGADGLIDVRPRLPGGTHSPVIRISPRQK